MKLWILVALTGAAVIPVTAPRLAADMRAAATSAHRGRIGNIRTEADPRDSEACFSMGRLFISYKGSDFGPPGVGLRISDPHGRTIGYDFGQKRGWQELPVAEASVECDENVETGELRNCQGQIEICGPLSGLYKVEVLPTQKGKYSIAVSARSAEKQDVTGFETASSHTELKSEIHDSEHPLLKLQYSREPGTQIRLTKSDERLAAGTNFTQGSPR
jgi:hypothetical protein